MDRGTIVIDVEQHPLWLRYGHCRDLLRDAYGWCQVAVLDVELDCAAQLLAKAMADESEAWDDVRALIASQGRG